MGKMIAVFEVEFDTDMMWDEESIRTEMDGDWLKAMKWLYESDGLGIFSDEDELKLVAVNHPNKPKKSGK